ncbi:MAG: hypothetical protein QG635_2401 [Bacteroidota bacterium]|nr:hypothetical protein [Bacteroidota bacterium]
MIFIFFIGFFKYKERFMKKLSLIALILLVSAGYIIAQTLAPTDPTTRNVVLEEYTGIHCTYCPDGHKRAQALADEFPGKVVLINVHAGSYANPSAGEPDFRTAYGEAFVANSYSGLTGFPAGTINRQVFPGVPNPNPVAPYYAQKAGGIALSRGGWRQAAVDSIFNGTISPVNIGAKSEWDEAKRELKVTVELYYTSDIPGGAKLNVALLESHVWGPQVGATDPKNYEHNHILRDLLTGQWGETLSNTNTGQTFNKVFTYNVNSAWDIDNCDIAVFVTKSNNYTSLTGIDFPVKMPIASITNVGEGFGVKDPSSPINSEFELTNISDKSLTFVASVKKSDLTPSDWTAELTSPTEFTVNPKEKSTIQVKFTMGSTKGAGDAIVEVVEKDNPASIVYTAKYTAVSNNINYLEVNDNNSNISEISKARNEAVSLQSSVFSQISDQLPNLKVVVWNTSAKGDLTSAEGDVINNLIAQNTGVLIMGSVALPTLAMAYSSHSLFFNLGVKSSSSEYITATSVVIKGVSGDPISDGYMFAATNTNNGYYLYTLSTVNSKPTTIFTAPDNSDKILGVRTQSGDVKSVVFSFNINVVQNIVDREALVKKALDWMEGTTGAEELDNMLSNTSIEMNVGPNPISGTAIVSYKLNGLFPQHIKMYVIDPLGNKVANLLDGEVATGQHTLNLETAGLSCGTYYIVADIGGKLTKETIVIQ